MRLIEKLRKIQGLNIDTKLKITFTDGKSIIGKYKGYTDSKDNEPEISQVDIETDSGIWYGFEEDEIKEIQKIE